jgi:3-oxoacyl-[acyl-carrier protein] reductase
MSGTLDGKVALVTGGSRGIGAAIAKRLAQDGADVAITYASAQAKADEVVRAITSSGRRAVAIRADSGDADAARGTVTETVRALGRIDVLVNNAGAAVITPLEQLTVEDFDRLVGERPGRLRRDPGSSRHGSRRARDHDRQRELGSRALQEAASTR